MTLGFRKLYNDNTLKTKRFEAGPIIIPQKRAWILLKTRRFEAGPPLQRILNYNPSKESLDTLESTHTPTGSSPSEALLSLVGSRNRGDEERKWNFVDEEEEEKMELWKLVPSSQSRKLN